MDIADADALAATGETEPSLIVFWSASAYYTALYELGQLPKLPRKLKKALIGTRRSRRRADLGFRLPYSLRADLIAAQISNNSSRYAHGSGT